MRSRLKYFFLLVFFLPTLSFASVTTGPISNATILAYKPTATLDTAGISRINLPVLAGEGAGMASISGKAAVGRLLGAARRGLLGPWGMAAITAAQLCYSETDWKICHSSIDPILPIDIDTSGITPAISGTLYTSVNPVMRYNTLPGTYTSYSVSDLCTSVTYAASSTFSSNYVCSGSNSSTLIGWSAYNKSTGALAYTGTFSYTSTSTHYCDSGILTNATGQPNVTGQFCTPYSAYSCPENYARSDSYGNLGDGMFCAYQAPVLTEQQQYDMLAPYLLNYYANQLFSGTDGKIIPDLFADADTTFDPTVTPTDMPMTWTQLQTYVDWYTSGKIQTTNPLAQYYVSPSNYEYTQNYVNTTNQTNTNTNSNTNVNPISVTSSASLTQTQYEESNKKFVTEQTTAFTSAFTTSSLEQLTTDKQEIIDKIGSPDAPPSDMPDIFNWVWPTGSCEGFNLQLTLYIPIIGTLNIDKLVNEHCEPYNDYFHPTFYWFFNMITLLYVFRLWDKTAADVAKI